MAEIRLNSFAGANAIFVGRTLPQRQFEDAALNIPSDRSSLLVFYGVGGQGKTWLCQHLLRKLLPSSRDSSYSFVRPALLDLHHNIPESAEHLLIRIRNLFATAGVSTPTFDLTLALLWQRWRPEQPMPRLDRPWLTKTTTAARGGIDGLSDKAKEWIGSETVAETIGAMADSVAVVGPIVKLIGNWVIEKGKRAYLEWTREHIEKLFHEGELKSPFEILKLLPWMLAKDLSFHVQRHERERLILMVDEYERIFDQGGGGTHWEENPFDQILRRLIAETDGLLVVFFTRERLSWGSDWQNDLRNRQHMLQGLQIAEANEWLEAIPIERSDIRLAMIDGARETNSPDASVYPLMVDLQIERYRALLARGAPIDPESFRVAVSGFEDRRRELVGRLLRDYGVPLQSTLQRVCWCRRFDRDIFSYVVKTFETAFPIDQFDKLSSLSILAIGEDGYLRMHQVIAEIIGSMQTARQCRDTMKALHFVFRKRATAVSSAPFGSPQLTALLEAAHYGSVLEPREFLDWLAPTRQLMRNHGHLSAGAELWRQIRARFLSEFGPSDRKTCFATLAYAQFLTSLGDIESADGLVKEVQNTGYRLTGRWASSFIAFAPTLDIATKWLDLAKQNHPPRPTPEDKSNLEVAFTSWLEHVEDLDTVHSIVEEMRTLQLRPNEFTFTRIMILARSFEKAFPYLSKMRKDGIKPSKYHYAVLLDLANTSEQIELARKSMQHDGIATDVVHYNTLIGNTEDLEKAESIFETMIAEGINPNVVTYTTMMMKAPDRDARLAYYERLRSDGIQPDEFTFSILIKGEPNFSEAAQWLQKMHQNDVKPNHFHAQFLAQSVSSIQEAEKFFEKMQNEEIKPDAGLLNETIAGVMSRAPTLDWEAETQNWLDLMNTAQIIPTISIYKTLLNFSPNIQSGLRLIGKLKAHGLSPDSGTYMNLISKAKSEEEAEKCLNLMTSEGLSLSPTVFHRLLQFKTDLQSAQTVLERMATFDIKPNGPIYSALISISPNLDTALGWIRSMLPQGIAVTEDITSALARNVATLEDAQRTSATLRQLGVKLGPAYYAGISKRLSTTIGPAELLEWRQTECPGFLEPLAAAIKSYSERRDIIAACEIAMHCPGSESAQALFRKYPTESQAVLEDIFAGADATFEPARALGYWAWAQSEVSQVKYWFGVAKDQATPAGDVSDINRIVKKIQMNEAEQAMREY